MAAEDITATRVAILLFTRALVEKDRFTFLCNAIGEAGWLLNEEAQAAILVAWVQKMLAPFGTYGGWIRSKHKHLAVGLTPEQFSEKAREGRLAWIDWMIQEVQK